MHVDVSSQGKDKYLMEDTFFFAKEFFNVGESPQGSYTTLRGYPLCFLFVFEALIKVGVSDHGSAADIRRGSLSFFKPIFEVFVNIGVSSQGG